MIEFTDITLRQTKGHYNETKILMEEDRLVSKWMIRSGVFVSSVMFSASYTLHFWNNRDVVIFDTDRSMIINSFDDDLRELSLWCQKAGWKHLGVNDRLLVDRHTYEFWKRSYVSGLIVNEKLKQHEDAEMDRLSKAYLTEEAKDL